VDLGSHEEENWSLCIKLGRMVLVWSRLRKGRLRPPTKALTQTMNSERRKLVGGENAKQQQRRGESRKKNGSARGCHSFAARGRRRSLTKAKEDAATIKEEERMEEDRSSNSRTRG